MMHPLIVSSYHFSATATSGSLSRLRSRFEIPPVSPLPEEQSLTTLNLYCEHAPRERCRDREHLSTESIEVTLMPRYALNGIQDLDISIGGEQSLR